MKSMHTSILVKVLCIIYAGIFLCDSVIPTGILGCDTCSCRQQQSCNRDTLAKDSLFDRIKQETGRKLTEDDVIALAEIITSLNKVIKSDFQRLDEEVRNLNGYLKSLDHTKTRLRRMQLGKKWHAMKNRAGEDVIIPVVSVFLANGAVLNLYFLQDASQFTNEQLLSKNIPALISIKDLGVQDLGITWKVPSVMQQTVNSQSKTPVDTKLVQEICGLLLKKTPFFWKKSVFKQIDVPPPAYLSKEKGWESFVYDLSTKGEIEVANRKYTQFGLNKLKVKLYSVEVAPENRGIIFEDGSRRLAYTHLYTSRNEKGENEGTLEIYLPAFLFDEKGLAAFFAKYKIRNIDPRHVAAQVIDREIGREIFGIPEKWMDVEAVRLNQNDFIAVTEADLYGIYAAKQHEDPDHIDRMAEKLAGPYDRYPPEIAYGLTLMADEVRLLWDNKILFPTTQVSKVDWDRELTKAEYKELSADPLFQKIQKLSSETPREEQAVSNVATEIMLDLFKRIEDEFGDKQFLKVIRKDARRCYVAIGRKRYEEAVNLWGKMRNEIAALKSPTNFNEAQRERVLQSRHFLLLEVLCKFLDYFYARYIEINGIHSLVSTMDENFIVDGQIRIVRTEAEYKQMCKDAKPWEIVVMAYMPDAIISMARVRGIITSNVGALQSHEKVRAKAMKIPLASIAHAPELLERLNGKWVRFTIIGNNGSIVPFNDEMMIQDAVAASKKPIVRQVTIPGANVSYPTNYITGLDAVTAPVSGYKAYNLRVLKQNMSYDGVSIPDGDVIPFSAYNRFLKARPDLEKFIADTLKDMKLDDMEDVENKLAAVRQKIVDTPFPPEMEKEIRQGLQKGIFKNGRPVIVRSSTNAEDLPDMSGAGLYDSYPNIMTTDDILMHIKKVWASVWNRSAFEWRIVFGINHSLVFPAVLIQEIIPADYAFVVFTAGSEGKEGEKTNRVIIEMVSGMGGSLVGEEKEYGGKKPARFVYDKKTDSVVSIDFGERKMKEILDEKGGVRKVEDNSMSRAGFEKAIGMPVEEFVKHIGRVTVVGEDVFEKPQDFEATLQIMPAEAGAKPQLRLNVVQARPIPGFPYYPVKESKVVEKYGSLVKKLYEIVRPFVDQPFTFDEKESYYPYGDFGSEDESAEPNVFDILWGRVDERYRVPLLKYILSYQNIGRKVVARLFWYPQTPAGAHIKPIEELRQLPAHVTAEIFRHMVIDFDDKKQAKLYRGIPNFTIEKCLSNWDLDYTMQVLRYLRVEPLALVTKGFAIYYSTVLEDNAISADEMRTMLCAVIKQKSPKQQQRFIDGLNEFSKDWLLQGMDSPFLQEMDAYTSHGATLVLSDDPDDLFALRQLFDERKIREKIQIDYSTENDLGRDTVRSMIKDKIQPGIIILNMRSWKTEEKESGKVVIELLRWLKEDSGLKATVILVASPGTQIPESFAHEYRVHTVVERNSAFTYDVLNALSESVKDILDKHGIIDIAPHAKTETVNQEAGPGQSANVSP